MPLTLDDLKQRDMTAETTMHTPGPWKFIDATKEAKMQYAPRCVIKAEEKLIASFSWNDNSPWFPTKDESQANARLIAAAPELLTALQSLVDQVLDYEKVNNISPNPGRKYCWDVTETAMAAIAKAEGRV